jgi:hypothetical protein
MPNGTIDPTFDYVAQFSTEMGTEWPAMVTARNDALQVQELLRSSLRRFTSDDVDIVVFGSLARREWTSGSDVDWTILIDGQADSQHRVASRVIDRMLAEMKFRETPLKGPGAEGIFGNLAFSHDIVHHIGGQADTNRNTTQRVLFLLEAVALRDPKDVLGGPYARIVRQILYRYLVSDSNFHSQSDHESRIPRFLLNDIVRYWRTICVDFAYKDWEYDGKKWAIRNIKLRTSRKLLFVSGLLMAFSCFKNESLRRVGEVSSDYQLKLQEHLLNFVHSTPLNILVWTLQELGLSDPCKEFLSLYEEFLGQINDQSVREHLGGLSENKVYSDEVFLHCRSISHQLQAILRHVFFEAATPLRDFTFEYGVF